VRAHRHDRDPKFDEVVAIPGRTPRESGEIDVEAAPFRVVVKRYYPNAVLAPRAQNPSASRSPTRAWARASTSTVPVQMTYKENERNWSTAFVELVGTEGSIDTWLRHRAAAGVADDSATAGRTWRLGIRRNTHKPFSLQLLKVSHDVYLGTDIPKNFSSRVRLTTPDGREDRRSPHLHE
ncbi:MAG: ResB protein required for cytochrome C biosynthesis, partial [Opitutus sp.]|nr:ResB protein required for cytochrome C biosynthesis [Opitutus sp.]